MRHKLINARRPWKRIGAIAVEFDDDGIPHTHAHKKAVNRPVRLVEDPTDMYERNVYFTVPELYFTAFFGYWPEGAIFELTCKSMGGRIASGKKKRRIQVQNGELVDTLNREKHIFRTKNNHRWVSLDE